MNNLGNMLIEIGTIINKYQEQSNYNCYEETKLLKAKEVYELYPILTPYGLNDAVKKGLIPVVKRGKLNFYDSKDIEAYIKELKVKVPNNEIIGIKAKKNNGSKYINFV